MPASMQIKLSAIEFFLVVCDECQTEVRVSPEGWQASKTPHKVPPGWNVVDAGRGVFYWYCSPCNEKLVRENEELEAKYGPLKETEEA